MSEKHIGKVLQVIGPVLDIQFEDGQLPELLNAIEIDNHGEKLVVEVAQHTGDNVVRCIAMNSTDGLVRGTEAVDTGEPIKVPVGDQCLGRVFNLLGEPVDNKPAPTPEAETPTPSPETPPVAVPGGVPVKTGLALLTSVSSSKDATADADGLAQADITVVAVTVGDDGIIYDCVIDSIQSKLNFDTSGALLSDLTLTIPSKNELGADYGMGKISSIGREWNEQAQSLADYVVGKTIPEVKGISISEEGKPTGADLTASVTMSIGGYISAIEQAAANASHLGASKGDRLVLTTTTNAAKSTDATSDADGLAQAYATVGALTLSGDTITSMVIDAVQANVNFNAAGTITTDLSAAQPSKNELGADYGMGKVSSIGKEWDEQAAAFASYVTGKTVAEATGIAVTEEGNAGDADLAASVTIGVGDFLTLVEKAGA